MEARVRIRRAGLLAGTTSSRFLPSTVVVLGAVAVLLMRSALWPYGYLEEFGLARSFQNEGFQAYFNRIGAQAGRPLSLLPFYVGLVSSNGGLIGMYAVFGALCSAQFVLVQWALRPVDLSRATNVLFGFAVALNPFWPAGSQLRFMPAQLSLVGLVVWFGCMTRVLNHRQGGPGRWRELYLTFGGAGALLTGLLAYQALAVVPLALLSFAALVATDRPQQLRRYGQFVAATLGAILTISLYGIVVVPRVFPKAYENGGKAPSVSELPHAVETLIQTALSNRPLVAVYAIGAALLALPFAVDRRAQGPAVAATDTKWDSVRRWGRPALWLGLPVTAVPYLSFGLHVGDQDRVVFSFSVALILAAALLLQGASCELAPRALVLGVGLVVAMCAWNVRTWRHIGRNDATLIGHIAGLARDTPYVTSFIVVDHSGRFGDVYTLLPPLLSLAVSENLDRDVSAELCTSSEMTRHHPVAARYPIGTTAICDPATFGRPRGTANIDRRVVEVFEGR